MPANQSTPEVTSHAADMLDQYASFIRNDVKADDFERHPYVPEIEEVAQALRDLAAPARGGDELREALRRLERQATKLYRSAAPAGNYGANANGNDRNENTFADRDEAIIAARAALASTDMAGAGEVLGHEYGPSRVGHGEAQCIHCLATNRENAVIAPNACPQRKAAPQVEGLTSGEEWQLVPVEPTDAMWDAFDAHNGDKRTGYDTWRKAWSAMLAAAPKATATASVRE